MPDYEPQILLNTRDQNFQTMFMYDKLLFNFRLFLFDEKRIFAKTNAQSKFFKLKINEIDKIQSSLFY